MSMNLVQNNAEISNCYLESLLTSSLINWWN